jgi:putative redox protein
MTKATAIAESIPHRQSVSLRTHTVLVDEPSALGGQDAGPDPFELIAAAVAACTSITVGMYCHRHGWDVEGLRVDCRMESDPSAGGRLEVVLHLDGALDDRQRDRLTTVARKCPVRRFLSSGHAFVDRTAVD